MTENLQHRKPSYEIWGLHRRYGVHRLLKCLSCPFIGLIKTGAEMKHLIELLRVLWYHSILKALFYSCELNVVASRRAALNIPDSSHTEFKLFIGLSFAG